MFRKGDVVSFKSNPDRTGVVTRVYEGDGDIKDYCYVFCDHRTIVCRPETLTPSGSVYIEDSISKEEFGDNKDLNNLIVAEKIRGNLTNIYYSMHAGETIFFPHQYKPVMMMNESSGHSLIIADEVGLGKTVEALSIWKEFSVKEGLSHLLIICPPNLQTKWKEELRKHFSIKADIVETSDLLDEIRKPVTLREPRVMIYSLIKMRNLKNEREIDAELLELLDYSAGEYLFDMIIIDEAHNLSNSETKSFRNARRFINASYKQVLLTATPIQNKSEDLFSLLNLINPTAFSRLSEYELLCYRNRPLRAVLSFLDDGKKLHEIEEGHKLVNELRTGYLSVNVPSELLDEADRVIDLGEDGITERLKVSSELASYNFLSQYMCRSCKSQVLPNSHLREAKTISFRLSQSEMKYYRLINDCFEEMIRNYDAIPISAITRKRLLASSFPIGAEHFMDLKLVEENEEDYSVRLFDNDDAMIGSISIAELKHILKSADLRKHDSKYNTLLQQLLSMKAPVSETKKVIIFTGFRLVGDYLESRLKADGFAVFYISGANRDRVSRESIIRNFRLSDAKPAILLSTEVGSEGIDLQFCNTIINYDLPWNPMRLEQRIGRIDRIGQASEKIFVYNIFSENTIEDQVLDALYTKINLFQGTIGSLETILGDSVSNLIINIAHPTLSQKERVDLDMLSQMSDKYIEELKNTISESQIDFATNNQAQMQSIEKAEKMGHYLTPYDLFSFIKYYLNKYYRGNTDWLLTELSSDYIYNMLLPPEVCLKLEAYCRRNHVETRLSEHREVKVRFDNKQNFATPPGMELITVDHPFVRWLSDELSTKQIEINPCSVVSVRQCDLKKEYLDASYGLYGYMISRFIASGPTGKRDELHYEVAYVDFKREEIVPVASDDEWASKISGMFEQKDIPEIMVNLAAHYGYKDDEYRSEYSKELGFEMFRVCRCITDDAFAGFSESFQTRSNSYRDARVKAIMEDSQAKIMEYQR
ncbi:MAG: DEAD/DEAH box helicase, partial [Bullifex sp.]